MFAHSKCYFEEYNKYLLFNSVQPPRAATSISTARRGLIEHIIFTLINQRNFEIPTCTQLKTNKCSSLWCQTTKQRLFHYPSFIQWQLSPNGHCFINDVSILIPWFKITPQLHTTTRLIALGCQVLRCQRDQVYNERTEPWDNGVDVIRWTRAYWLFRDVTLFLSPPRRYWANDPQIVPRGPLDAVSLFHGCIHEIVKYSGAIFKSNLVYGKINDYQTICSMMKLRKVWIVVSATVGFIINNCGKWNKTRY